MAHYTGRTTRCARCFGVRATRATLKGIAARHGTHSCGGFLPGRLLVLNRSGFDLHLFLESLDFCPEVSKLLMQFGVFVHHL